MLGRSSKARRTRPCVSARTSTRTKSVRVCRTKRSGCGSSNRWARCRWRGGSLRRFATRSRYGTWFMTVPFEMTVSLKKEAFVMTMSSNQSSRCKYPGPRCAMRTGGPWIGRVTEEQCPASRSSASASPRSPFTRGRSTPRAAVTSILDNGESRTLRSGAASLRAQSRSTHVPALHPARMGGTVGAATRWRMTSVRGLLLYGAEATGKDTFVKFLVGAGDPAAWR